MNLVEKRSNLIKVMGVPEIVMQSPSVIKEEVTEYAENNSQQLEMIGQTIQLTIERECRHIIWMMVVL